MRDEGIIWDDMLKKRLMKYSQFVFEGLIPQILLAQIPTKKEGLYLIGMNMICALQIQYYLGLNPIERQCSFQITD